MKKLVLATVLLLGLSAMAMAQDVPMAEVFGGYSFYHCDFSAPSNCNFNGWNAAVDFNVNKNWGAVIDVSGFYGYMTNVNTIAPYGKWPYFNSKTHNFLFGPRYTFRTKKVTEFVQVLMGVNHVNPQSVFAVQNNFAIAFGGGIDVKVNDRISIRPVQIDYITARVVSNGGFNSNSTFSTSGFNDNLRFSTGFVFKFGKR